MAQRSTGAASLRSSSSVREHFPLDVYSPNSYIFPQHQHFHFTAVSRIFRNRTICSRPNATLYVIRKLLTFTANFRVSAEVCKSSAYSVSTTAGILRFTFTGRFGPRSRPPSQLLRPVLDLIGWNDHVCRKRVYITLMVRS